MRVDAFGSIEPLRNRYEAVYREWKDLIAKIEATRQTGAERGRLEDLLRFQVQEIEQAGLLIDEEMTFRLNVSDWSMRIVFANWRKNPMWNFRAMSRELWYGLDGSAVCLRNWDGRIRRWGIVRYRPARRGFT